MSFKDFIPEGLKHALLTDDDPALAPQAAPSKSVFVPNLRTYPTKLTVIPNPAGAATATAYVQPTATFEMVNPLNTGGDLSSQNNFTTALKAKTDFDQTDIGKQVAHEMKPLDGIASLTEADKINIALKAGAEEGLTAEKIIATFDSLLSTLESENSGFQNAVAAATQSGPEAIKSQIQAEADKIKDLEAQITASRAKQSDLSTELIKATSKIQTNTMQFSAAYEARKSELTSSKSHYQSILAGIKA